MKKEIDYTKKNTYEEEYLKEYIESRKYIGKYSIEEYYSILDNYEKSKNVDLTQTLNWLDNRIEKISKEKYIEKKEVKKMITKIADVLGIKSKFFNNSHKF
ncbi:hypothetical protein [Polaribacter atrinae]|uniref:Uncharacterized protein n=1 Tax=Polaribacter atrinae TaxID=1333662 RepID=A0A176SUU3_9FLAO|nr:hypothetical protein [Polaribacter atrinae]OAD39452.1 hypothetical protein LPB303_17030 [Polaribacter atrinae]